MEKKQVHEKLHDKELDLKAAQEVHYANDFKKADKAGEKQRNEEKKDDPS